MIDDNEPEYRPSFAAFCEKITVKDLLGVTCLVMIFLLLVLVFGVYDLAGSLSAGVK
jgi:hypothetical protein